MAGTGDNGLSNNEQAPQKSMMKKEVGRYQAGSFLFTPIESLFTVNEI